MHDPRSVALKENLPAMKATAGSGGSLFLKEPSKGLIVMSNKHKSALLEAEGVYFQALCSCGWFSNVSFKEEVDLLRAMHIHQMAVFTSSISDRN